MKKAIVMNGKEKQKDDLISRQAAIEQCFNGWNKTPEEIAKDIKALPPAQHYITDTISRQAAIDAAKRLSLGETDATRLAMRIGDYLERLQSAQPEDWMERNKERILQAGMEGREVEFYIGGRLFAIREIAQ